MKNNEEILKEVMEKSPYNANFALTKEYILQAMDESNKQLVTAINELIVFLLQHPEKAFFKEEEIPVPNFKDTVNLLYVYLNIFELEDKNKPMIITDSYVVENSKYRTVSAMLYGLNLKR